MKYRVIKDFPSVFIEDYKIGDIIDENNFGLFNKCKKFPEYFEEVKELFVTEDKKSMYNGDYFYALNKKDFKIRKLRTSYSINKENAYDCGYLYFSSEEVAQDWVDKNQKLYSKQEILDAIVATDNYCFVSKSSFEATWNKKFLEKLNINIE